LGLTPRLRYGWSERLREGGTRCLDGGASFGLYATGSGELFTVGKLQEQGRELEVIMVATSDVLPSC